jgi:hypothetical protein
MGIVSIIIMVITGVTPLVIVNLGTNSLGGTLIRISETTHLTNMTTTVGILRGLMAGRG